MNVLMNVPKKKCSTCIMNLIGFDYFNFYFQDMFLWLLNGNVACIF